MKFTIFISYAHEDEFIAKKLKKWLEEIFLNAEVFMSGTDIRGGSFWGKEILEKLKGSKAIIVLLTKKSWERNWVYFEAGAGLTEEKAIPICCGGYSVGDLKSPLSIFQARNMNEKDMLNITKDIAKLAEIRPPSEISTKTMIAEIESFLKERNKKIGGRTWEAKDGVKVSDHIETRPSKEVKVKIAPSTDKEYDPELRTLSEDFSSKVRAYLLKNIEKGKKNGVIPQDIDTKDVKTYDLYRIVTTYFDVSKFPPGFRISLFLNVDARPPLKDAPQWEKYSFEKKMLESLKIIENLPDFL